jgi:hypothetical protein
MGQIIQDQYKRESPIYLNSSKKNAVFDHVQSDSPNTQKRYHDSYQNNE